LHAKTTLIRVAGATASLKEANRMSEATLPHEIPSVYEPSLFGTYSKKIGMWLFLMSDSLTFGALLYAYSYGRISTPNWPTPFHSESIVNATIMTAFLLTSSLTMVLAVRASAEGNAKSQRLWLLATMACGMGFVLLHGREWSKLIAEGLSLPVFPKPPGSASAGEYANVVQNVPQFPATFFGLTGMHMLHVTLGVVYLGIVALRRYFIPILLVFWLAAWLGTPAYSPFHYGAHVLLLAAIVCSIILWLKPKVYDSSDVEVAGLYWHFVDLVWMFIFPLVYLMSAKIL
jgi:heme/copper-type cytochrome/quinol oxidase subunit 3